MHTCGYSEHQEHGLTLGLSIKKRYITRLLFILNGSLVFDVHFEMLVMSKRNPRIFLFFVYEMLCHWSTSETNLVETI